MFIKPTALIYSSHNRCDYLHREWIVQRALESYDNKTIFYLPMSMERYDQQEYTWSTFSWYFDLFRQYGLDAKTFFWTDNLSKWDVDVFFSMLFNSEVVILGGGNAYLGFERYDALGGWFYGDYDLFKNILHQRQADGKLTVGFSAGAIQLSDASLYDEYHRCYALMHNVTAVLHYDRGREGDLRYASQRFPHCLVFGLPNDSGIATNQGYLPSGNKWQILQFIIDNSWYAPEDAHHIKTRQGMKIEHYYHDGRKWAFNGGDSMVRVFSPDYSYQGTWILQPNNPVIFDYWAQQPTGYHNIEHILSTH